MEKSWNLQIKACLVKNMKKELVVKRWEKLGYIKSKGACINIFDPSWVNEIHESNSSINCQTLFKSTQLTQINEIVWDQIELKSFTNNFLNEFTDHIEKDNGSERFGRVIWLFVRFRYDNGSWCFEIWCPIA